MRSVRSVLKNIFSTKQREEPNSRVTDIFELEEYAQPPPASSLVSALNYNSYLPAASPCPVGLYCVIEEFLTEYDTRLLEEEQRAELLASRTKQIS